MSSNTEESSGMKVMTRKHLFNVMQGCQAKTVNEKLEYLGNFLLNHNIYSEELKHKITHLIAEFKRRWCSVRYKKDLFEKQNLKWLEGTFEIPTLSSRSARQLKPFTELSERSKRRRTEDLRNNNNTEELIFATRAKLWCSGQVNASIVLGEVTKCQTYAEKCKKLSTIRTSTELQQTDLQAEITQPNNIIKALYIFAHTNLSREDYNTVRTMNTTLFPSYSILRRAMNDCYPLPEAFIISDTSAEIRLQELVNHTAARLLLYLEEVLNNLEGNEISKLELISKWGCDGSKQAQYKQKFDNISDSDSHVFQSSFVPLRLISTENRKIIWDNPIPSSPRYCRPIRFRYIKENINVIQDEKNYIEDQIDNLTETEINGNRPIAVKHTLLFTMIDGKICNAVTNTSSTMKCYICGLSSIAFNNLSKKGEINVAALRFGLSILHARIKIFENLLHLSYKLHIRKWQIRSKEEKSSVAERKKIIQQEFKSQIGLTIDVPKAGLGNTNDGNTSRRFFLYHVLSSTITGIDVELIYRLRVILETISSGYKIDLNKFGTYTMDTAKLYIKLYSWYPMSPTMHKILIHAPSIIENAVLPIGKLSEEAAEARNKDFRRYRENNARKCSRKACNTDVLNRLLITSDPLISSTRQIRRKKSNPFLSETLKLILPSEHPSTEEEQGSEEEEEDNDDNEEEKEEECEKEGMISDKEEVLSSEEFCSDEN